MGKHILPLLLSRPTRCLHPSKQRSSQHTLCLHRSVRHTHAMSSSLKQPHTHNTQSHTHTHTHTNTHTTTHTQHTHQQTHTHTHPHTTPAHPTANGGISEEEPAGDEGLLGVTGLFVHDVQVG